MHTVCKQTKKKGNETINDVSISDSNNLSPRIQEKKQQRKTSNVSKILELSLQNVHSLILSRSNHSSRKNEARKSEKKKKPIDFFEKKRLPEINRCRTDMYEKKILILENVIIVLHNFLWKC